LQAGG